MRLTVKVYLGRPWFKRGYVGRASRHPKWCGLPAPRWMRWSVVKDATGLLDSTERSQILQELRGLYDNG